MTEELVIVEEKEVTFEERVETAFLPKIMERNVLADMYGVLIKKELTEEVCAEAKALRLKFVKVRTGIDKIHKTQKDYFLAGGRFVDSWKNKETEPVTQMERELKGIETHFEKIEEEKLQRIHEARKSQLEEANALHIPDNLAILTEEAWQQMFNGAKMFNESEKKRLEEERIEKDRLDAIEKLQLKRKNHIINNNLFQYRDAEWELDALGLLNEEEWKALINQFMSRQKEADAERQRIADENEALRFKNAKIAKALQDREDADRKLEEKKESDLVKGDTAKLRDLIADLTKLKTKYEFKSKTKKKAYTEMGLLIDKVIAHVK